MFSTGARNLERFQIQCAESYVNLHGQLVYTRPED